MPRDVNQKLAMRSSRRGAFTLIDLLVSISVIAVLIALLLPSLAAVNETSRRVVCQSNIRQIGLGVVMYADDRGGYLPYSLYLGSGASSAVPEARPQDMLTLRVPDQVRTDNPFDGIGLLFSLEYLPAPKVFYCPSHTGENPYSRYARSWGAAGDEIVGNYHYRGEGPAGRASRSGARAPTTRILYAIDPAQSSLIADGMRVRSDYNHKVGVNFFRADLMAHWFDDRTLAVADSLPESKDGASSTVVESAWARMDAAANAGQPN